MISIRRATTILAMVAIVGAGVATKAEAVPIISVTPSGNQIDISLSNLEEPVGGFSFLLDFSAAVLATGYSLNPAFGTTNFVDYFDLTNFNGGAAMIDFNITSFLDPATLAANQGNPAVGSPVTLQLLTVDFNGPVDNEAFQLFNVDLSNNAGTALIPVECAPGQPCPTVPEPASLALLMTGAAVLAVRRRSRQNR